MKVHIESDGTHQGTFVRLVDEKGVRHALPGVIAARWGMSVRTPSGEPSGWVELTLVNVSLDVVGNLPAHEVVAMVGRMLGHERGGALCKQPGCRQQCIPGLSLCEKHWEEANDAEPLDDGGESL